MATRTTVTPSALQAEGFSYNSRLISWDKELASGHDLSIDGPRLYLFKDSHTPPELLGTFRTMEELVALYPA